MKRCKHIGLLYQGAFWLECCECGEWLSLGPSNDESAEVAIEIAAAFRAAKYADESRVLGYDRFDLCPYGGEELCDTCLVNYLAGCIHTHSREERE